MWRTMNDWNGDFPNTGLLMWMPVIIMAVIVGIVYLIVYLVNKKRGGSRSKNYAVEILRERYARGEISDQEFEEKKKKLEE